MATRSVGKVCTKIVICCTYVYTDFALLRRPQGHVQSASTIQSTPKKKAKKAALKPKSAKTKKDKKKAKEDSEADEGDSGSSS